MSTQALLSAELPMALSAFHPQGFMSIITASSSFQQPVAQSASLIMSVQSCLSSNGWEPGWVRVSAAGRQ